MAVYTDVSEGMLRAFLSRYNIGEIVSYKGIAEGVENTNYLLVTGKGKYILTLYEKRVNPRELPFFLQLMEHLASAGVNCPLPIHDRAGMALGELAGRPAAIVTFLEGKSPRSIRNFHLSELGHHVAKMHLATEGFTSGRPNTMGIESWPALRQSTEAGADAVKPGLKQEIKEALTHVREHWPTSLPSGVIHADLFTDNVFFDGETLTGIIDFYFACNDFYIYDLAIILNDWCFEPGNAFNITKAKALLSAYDRVRPLSAEEMQALPVLATGAALRFLLSRLYDWINQVEGALVTPKDPLEYLAKLRFHRQVQSIGEYGL